MGEGQEFGTFYRHLYTSFVGNFVGNLGSDVTGMLTDRKLKALIGETVHLRRQLQAAQTAVATALTSGGPVPSGFDKRLIGVAAAALQNKRLRAALKAWPVLQRSLPQKEMERWFRIYAAHWPQPPANPRQDARGFVKFLRRQPEAKAKLPTRLRARWGRLLPRLLVDFFQ